MTKIVLNNCYGGFDLSEMAYKFLEEKYNMSKDEIYDLYCYSKRCDPRLVDVVETLGKKANSEVSELVVLQFEGNKYFIEEYDGYETIKTPDSIPWVIVE